MNAAPGAAPAALAGGPLPGMGPAGGAAAAAAAAQPFDAAHIAPSDRVAYDSLFFHTVAAQHPELLEAAAAAGGALDETRWRLSGAAAAAFFRQSGVPDAALAAVWALADIDRDNALDRAEFALAMHLTRLARRGAALPAVLPRTLVPDAKALHYNVAATGLASWTTFDSAPAGATASQQQQMCACALAATGAGTLAVAEPGALGVSAAEAAGFDRTAGAQGRDVPRRDGSQMPHFALPGASFEQKIALESELVQAAARRGAGAAQQ